MARGYYLKNTFLLFSIWVLSSCASKNYIDVRNFKSIGLTQDIYGLQNKGFVTSTDCGWIAMGVYSLTAPPTFEDVLEKAVSLKNQNFMESIKENFSENSQILNTQIKMLSNIQTRVEGWNIYFLGRSCLKLTAIAYQ
jgi:hypothetical protein